MVSQIDYRIREAEKLGFRRAIVPYDITRSKTFRQDQYKLELVPMKHIRDLGMLFKK
jgi:predicted ATP-dependent serine protease